MIQVEGKNIQSFDDLSANFFTQLEYIKGGSNWLNWAVFTAKSLMCDARNEDDLLCQIQMGLHGEEMIRFDAWQAGIQKVLKIDIADLQSLATMNEGEEAQGPFEQLLLKYQLVSNQQLASNDDFLKTNDPSGRFNTLALDLADQIKLYQFINNEKKLNQTAFAFSLKHSSSVDELINHYAFYVTATDKHTKRNMSAQQKAEIVQKLYHQYEQLCNFLIRVPNVGVGNTDKELNNGIRNFIASIQFVGYANKAASMNNLIRNVEINNDLSLNEDAIENYMAGIRDKVLSAPDIPACTVSQDGQTRNFNIPISKGRIVLNVDTRGDVTLSPKTSIQ